MSLRINLTSISAIQGRQLFFDANVLLYLFGGNNPSTWTTDTYSSIFSQCLKMGNGLCVDVFVISEFINRFLRLEYAKYLKNNNLNPQQIEFKNFRSQPYGIQASQDVELIVKGTILNKFSLVGKLFDTASIHSINLVNSDFNDELIIKTCQEHRCVLVTNDADFSGANVDILTANTRLK